MKQAMFALYHLAFWLRDASPVPEKKENWRKSKINANRTLCNDKLIISEGDRT
jgi:hypothetical protein